MVNQLILSKQVKVTSPPSPLS